MKRFTRKRKLLFLVISGTLISFMTLIASGFEEHNDHEPLFPFLISYDSPDNVVNMSHLLKGPAGTDGFLRIENGRFINDAGPIRLNGTNLTGPANFPTHVEAERLAARLARFGINCVRLHYMDDFYGNFLEEKQQGILTDDPETQRNLDSAQLDKLDYLIAELKKRGIYVNINLHVARKWDERDDFTDKNNRPQHDKGVDNFYPRMIELQKEYARKLLTHVNPYTKLAYTDDPAVALVEINNENGIFREYMRGAIDNLPNPYRGELVKQWNSWLKNKYGNSEKMYIAWEHSSQTEEDQSERIPEGSFSKNDPLDEKLWIVQKGGADVTLDVSGGVLKVTTSGKAKDKFPKIFRSAINVKKDQVYNVSFRIRKTSDGNPTQLGFAIADGVKGWRSLGVLRTINVGKEWLEVQSTFVALHDSEKAQIQLTRFAEGNYEIDDISLSGSEINFDKTKSIENASVDIVNRKDVLSPTASRDFIHFLYDTEAKYWKEMYDFLRDELKVKSPIAGGQLSFTPTTTQTQLDFIDNHAYWTHPSINKNWRIKNSSMVNNMQTIRRLAGERVEGFPYTISEYNHPFPNQYGAEGQPMLRAYGALQGWDGVFQYTYNHRQDAEPEMNTYFFSMAARTDVLAHMPACAAIFLRGDVSEAQKSVIANLSEDEYLEKFVDNRSMIINFSRLGIDTRSSLIHRTAIDYSGKNKGMPFFSVDNLPNSKVLMSDNGELLWNTEIENAGYFTVNTENTKLFTGFPADRTISMGDVSLSVGKTRLDWATISLVSKNESGFGEDGKSSNILLTATGVSQNKGMKVQNFPDAMMRIDDWGSAPVMVEGIPATISLPADAKRVKCYALDEQGERKSEVPVMASVGHGSNIEIKPAYQTIWYEIEVR